MNDQERQYWNGLARHYERKVRILSGPLPEALERVARHVRGARTVLEVAAGTGLFTVRVAREAEHVVASDFSPAMVHQLRQNLAHMHVNVECRVESLEEAAAAGRRFDVVLAANVLHLVDDLEDALRRLEQCVDAGGKLIVPTYCHDQTWTSRLVSRLMSLTGFPAKRRLTVDRISTALERAGLMVEEAGVVNGILPMAVVVARRSLDYGPKDGLEQCSGSSSGSI